MTRSGLPKFTQLGALVGLAVLVASCADDSKPLNTFNPEGPAARDIDKLMFLIWPAMFIVGILVGAAVLYFVITGRVNGDELDPDDLPKQVHGNTLLEWTWTAVPGVGLLVVAMFTIAAIWQLEGKNEPGELDVMVIGQQWWWEYRYDVDGDGFFADADGDGEIWGPDGEGGDADDREWPLELALDPDDISVANELVIPAGMQVDLTITSRDVIHSFWIPRLNGKRDAVPGRYHTWSVEADEPGNFGGWCTEYCGLSHARMRMSVMALAPADFDAWLANQSEYAAIPAEGTPEWDGRATFQAQCASCHVINEDPSDPNAYAYPEGFESAVVAKAVPNLTHFATRTAYAGAMYGQYVGIDPNEATFDASGYLELSETERLNAPALRRWISNAPEQKAMDADGLRGMPAFPQLSEAEIEDIVLYLETLD